MAKVYQSLLKDISTSEDLKTKQDKITLGEGLGWKDEKSNTIQVLDPSNFSALQPDLETEHKRPRDAINELHERLKKLEGVKNE